MKLLKQLKQWLNDFGYYATLDINDSSITLSKPLLKRIKHKEKATNILVFKYDNNYAFTFDLTGVNNTQIATLQYNAKHNCYGFETLCPTVARILYDYNITKPRAKLSVTIQKNHGRTLYLIERPCEKIKNK